MKKIFFLSVSRSDFDRYYSIISSLNKINKSENTILISGSHYSKKFGNTYKVIVKSGFNFIKAIDKEYITNTEKYSSNIVNITSKLIKIFTKNKPDLLVILGDRYEMISGALASLDKNIPILNLAWHIDKEIKKYLLSNKISNRIYNIVSKRDFNKKLWK